MSGKGALKAGLQAVCAKYGPLIATVEQEARDHLRTLKANLGTNVKDIRLTSTVIG